ncbi:sulfurtransferase [Prosthecobacter sp.]|uniref:sulfurtransferase n=1 Tax=Prosthecobacter sp. TaxID=1965333 RepID=UPI0037840426
MSASAATITNISCYQFADLSGLKDLRARLLERCRHLGLKGTILLSTEGINMFVAGARENVDALVDELRCIPGLEALKPKYSESLEQPFRRMLVRIKKEIIAFGVEGIEPAKYTSPRLEPKVLKQWLDEGRPVILYDTRNDYEVKLGTFKGAVVAGVDSFREFPEAVRKLPPEMKKAEIVSFCTGGIRCEKAAPFMEREGFEHVWQLEGGILKYFEECGSAHYEGECFVFDQRVGVDPGLHETASSQCFACQTPLTSEEQADPRYVEHVSCPYCFKTSEQQQRENLEQRHAALRAAVTPLPGSVPYDQTRPLNVPEACDSTSILDCLCHVMPHIPREQWLAVCEEGRIVTDDREIVPAHQIVRAGERYLHLKPAQREPDVNADIRVLCEDEAIIVLNKPAPLPVHVGGRFNRNTLQFILNTVWHPLKPRSVHRLDANTTGVTVLCKTRHFASFVQPQFERGEVEKIYLARVKGHPSQDEFACEAPVSGEAGKLGGRNVDAEGQEARTEFRVLRRDADGTALLEARPLTGRTNQIRIHLWHLGYAILGDATYLADGSVGETQTLAVGDPPLCLHALRITFTHPLTKERVTFSAEQPEWAR